MKKFILLILAIIIAGGCYYYFFVSNNTEVATTSYEYIKIEKGNIKKIQIYPKKSKAMNLAFDVTPAKYVTGLITEKGICEASERGLKELFK